MGTYDWQCKGLRTYSINIDYMQYNVYLVVLFSVVFGVMSLCFIGYGIYALRKCLRERRNVVDEPLLTV